MMKCIICGNEQIKRIFGHKIMGKYEISYYRCAMCNAIMTEQPFWLDEAYAEDKAVVDFDTGIMSRNISFSKVVNAVLTEFYNEKKSFVDWGGVWDFCKVNA